MKKVHFIGIGGIGMSALARILLQKQVAVSGSDLSRSAVVHALEQEGALVSMGHEKGHVPSDAWVVYNSRIASNNPEYAAAVVAGQPLLHRSELLAQLQKGRRALAVAGSHGKTTTSALLAHVLLEAQLDPSFALGGLLRSPHLINGRWGEGQDFVFEADESDGSFIRYQPQGAIVTNIDPEHMVHFGTEEALCSAFGEFMKRVGRKELLFFCADDPRLEALQSKGVSYGFKEGAELRIESMHQEEWRLFFTLRFGDKRYEEIELSLIGKHNVLNGAAVFGLALRLGVPEQQIRLAFRSFPGVARRMEKKGESRGVLFLDDYAHHPTEIRATLRGLREAVGERAIHLLFQPHRYTRLRDHFDDFATAFEEADFLYLTPVYSAGEEALEGFNHEALCKRIQELSTVPCLLLSPEQIAARLRPHDLFVTMGAGSIDRVHEQFMKQFAHNPPPKIRVGLLFGGMSPEHEISLRSARFVHRSLNAELYEVELFGIHKEGQWVLGREAERTLHEDTEVSSAQSSPLLSPQVIEALDRCDLFFPVMHGPFGEDGTLQGFFELLGKPYAGPNFRSAALCMDKVLTKRAVEHAGVPTPRFVSFGVREWRNAPERLLEQIAELKLPLFVKPSHSGSSIGITKVEQFELLPKAIEYAFRYDTDLLVEEGKEGCRELEFAVLGNWVHRIGVPSPGEKLAQGAFVDYQMKYGSHSIKTEIAPEMSPKELRLGKELALKAYLAAQSSGMTRVDFLLDREGQFWFFEMNPIPGLQPLSLFPKIWKREGVEGEALVSRLIILGLERARSQKRHFLQNLRPPTP